jgi:hypothetical protein
MKANPLAISVLFALLGPVVGIAFFVLVNAG